MEIEAGAAGARTCIGCENLKAWVDREIVEKEYLQGILFSNVGLIKTEAPSLSSEPEQYVATRGYIPFRVKRAKKEAERREEARVAKSGEKTEAEQLFEQELAKVK